MRYGAIMRGLLFFSLMSGFLCAGSLYAASCAYADIHPTPGNQVQGRVIFQQQGNGVRITAHLTHLKPGTHGFHVHEKGDCSGDATSAGGHYNPYNQPHAGPDSSKRHVGDLGNIVADEKGVAFYDRVDSYIALDGPYSIIGRAVIVHADPDDFVTQPTGNAGARIGCGVIQSN
jgi:Cu-Zn family superoxide dismutase